MCGTSSGSPAVCLCKGGEPSPSHSQRANPRLVSPPAPQALGFRVPAPRAAPCLVPPSASPDGLAPVLREPARSGFGFAFVSLRSFASPSGSASLRRWSCFAALGALRSPREAANPLRGFAFNVCSRRTQIGNLQSMVRCSIFKRDLSRAPCARDGSGYAAKRKPYFLFRRRGLAAQETTAPDLQKPAFREPHLSGQPGGWRLALQQA